MTTVVILMTMDIDGYVDLHVGNDTDTGNDSTGASSSLSFDTGTSTSTSTVTDGDADGNYSPAAYVVLLYGFLSGLTLITITGNTLVIVAVATTRRLRSVTNCFIVSLSVADLLVGILVMPVSLVYDIVDRWPFGPVVCELWSSLDIMLCTASIINLCCISLDRYFAITRPLTYTVKRNKRMALGMIAVVWTASAAVTCPPLLGLFDRNDGSTASASGSVSVGVSGHVGGSDNGSSGGSESDDRHQHHHRHRQKEVVAAMNGGIDDDQCRYIQDIGYVIFSASGSFYIPLVVMLFVYTRIFAVIYRRNKVVKQQKRYQQSTCCGNGCVPADVPSADLNRSVAGHSDNRPIVVAPAATAAATAAASKSNKPSSNHRRSKATAIWTKNGVGAKFRTVLRGSFRDLRDAQSDCQISLEMVSDSLLAMRPRCDSSSASVNGQHRNTTAAAAGTANTIGPLQRSRSFQFHYETAGCSSVPHVIADTAVSPCGITVTRTIGVPTAVTSLPSTTATSPANVKTHLLAVPEWSRGKSRPTTISSSLSPTDTTHDRSPWTDSSHTTTTTTTTTDSMLAAAAAVTIHRPKASLPTDLSPCDDDHTDAYLRMSISATTAARRPSAAQARRDLRRKQIRGIRMSFRKETKATTTIAVVVGGFVVCWLPFFIVYIVNPFCDACSFSRMLVSSLSWLGWANSAVNPFIYAFYNMDFRTAFWRLTIGRFRKKSVDHGHKAMAQAVVVYPQVWRSRLKNARINGLPSIVMVQSDVL